jgi:hypothetical protein
MAQTLNGWRGKGPEIRFLWLIPISASEVIYKKQHGLEALESLFEQTNLDYLKPNRASVI